MAISRNELRYVLAVGDASDEVAGHDGVAVIQRLDRVVLVETSASTAAELRRAGRPHVHVYDSEKAARAALGLFQH
jgi:hypothetical protein